MSSELGRRRDRLRSATVAEIKESAWRLIGASGPDALSLRAIARHMGMATGTVYGYFASRDELITALISDAYDELVVHLGSAIDNRRGGDRLIAYGRAFRQWAVDRPDLFRLVYGDPVSGYRPPPLGAAPEAEARACAMLIEMVDATSLDVVDRLPDADWADFAPEFATAVRTTHPELSARVAAAAFRVWGRLHGLVALEVHGHLTGAIRDTAKLYDSELSQLAASLE